MWILMFKCVVFLALATAAAAAPKYNIMPWMCLERCGDNIPAELAEIKAHADVLTAVSYEAFDLGLAPDGKTPTIIDNNFTHVGPELKSYGMLTYPMITTVDINKLRILFSNVRDATDCLLRTLA